MPTFEKCMDCGELLAENYGATRFQNCPACNAADCPLRRGRALVPLAALATAKVAVGSSAEHANRD